MTAYSLQPERERGGTVKRKHTGNTASQKQRGCAGEAIS